MILPATNRTLFRAGARPRAGFSLVELLTVMFIIAVLIGILVPSLNAARNAAKKSSTAAAVRSVSAALEMFKNENGRDFPQTHGYPPSYAHPPIADRTGTLVFTPDDAREGKFPFLQQDYPQVFGAQWLPAMLVGVDGNGYISRGSVPRRGTLDGQPWKWYTDDPDEDGTNKRLDRRQLYLNTTEIDLLATEKLSGVRNPALFPDWEDMKSLPVIIDAFGQPLLYYAANSGGTGRNMIADEREEKNVYAGGPQEEGPPIFFHDDNHGFTGDEEQAGWLFGRDEHVLARAGEDITADQFSDPEEPLDAPVRDTFAWYILDRKQRADLLEKRLKGETIDPKTPLRAINADSYLLISAGADGRFGTNDDVTNFPLTDAQ